MLCLNDHDGGRCGYQLTMVAATPPSDLRPAGSPPATPTSPPQTPTTLVPSPSAPEMPDQAGLVCPNGHPVFAGDLFCLACGAEIADAAEAGQPVSGGPQTDDLILPDWVVEREAPHVAGAERRCFARHRETGGQAVVTLYRQGAEPDPDVYALLRRTDADHIAQLFDIGRHDGRAYDVTEAIAGGALSDLTVERSDLATIQRIVDEIARALIDFHAAGLRHRNLTPEAITIRTAEPLDLVIEGFATACLSEFDLDVVAPLETTIYTAPEAVPGGVAAASDWWSLGMILLRLLAPEALRGVSETALLIQALTGDLPIPADLPPPVATLLEGLLTRDRRDRWGGDEVQRWLRGESVPTRSGTRRMQSGGPGATPVTISLAGHQVDSLYGYALRAAEADCWDEARGQLTNGRLASWAEQAGLDGQGVARLNAMMQRVPDPDFQLGIALKLLNPNMPLVHRGDIVTPAWLLDDPDRGYALVMGPATEELDALGLDPWLGQLRRRAETVERRARNHQIELDPALFRVYSLSTSRPRLLAELAQRRSLFPDTDHAGIATLLDRGRAGEDDLILLLAAEIGQFRPIDAVVKEATRIADRAGVKPPRPDFFRHMLQRRARRDIFRLLSDRIADFARCGLDTLDGWADQFRLERRIPLARALVLLAIPPDRWQQPSEQKYVAEILKHFAAKSEVQITRGPLARMKTSKASEKIDLTEFDPDGSFGQSCLAALLERSSRSIDLTTHRMVEQPEFAARLRRLFQRSELYRRDTGIDGLYMGFPFVVMEGATRGTRPRIAPVLLWPIKLTGEIGRTAFRVGFDQDREEVRLNPALESFLGPEVFAKWAAVRDDLLTSSVTVAAAVEAFALFGNPMATTLTPLPPETVQPEPGETRLYPAAVFFHMTYMGQQVIENLRHLARIPPADTALAHLLRLHAQAEPEEIPLVRELDRYFVAAIDPSQEQAVIAARQAPGIVISGPPGTGKSQSLVNIVSDCIGRGESVLICCAKQSALDVVSKRLTAEGLGDRAIMVMDVNRDRARILRHLRNLVAQLPRNDEDLQRIQAARGETAAKIESHERELQAHHRALHAQIGDTGRSYRDVVAELLALENAEPEPPIDAPSVRATLAGLSLTELVELEEAVSPHVSLWLDAAPVGSANALLKPFASDKVTADRYRTDLATFAAAHQSWQEAQAATGTASFKVPDIDRAETICATMLDHYPAELPATSHLDRWFGSLTEAAGPGGVTIVREVEEVVTALDRIDGYRHSDRFFAATLQERDSGLSQRLQMIATAEQASPLRVLNPLWYMARSALKAYMGRHIGTFDTALVGELEGALALEHDLRPIRRALGLLSQRAGYRLDPVTVPVSELVVMATRLRDAMRATERFVVAVRDVPGQEDLLEALQDGTRASLEAFRDRLAASIDTARRHRDALAAFERLANWLLDLPGMAWRRDLDAGVARDQLRGLLDAQRTVEAYQRFRHVVAEAPPAVPALFEQLDTARTALAELDPVKRSGAVRRLIQREARLGWKQQAEEAETALGLGRDDLEHRIRDLEALDQRIRAINRQLLEQNRDRRQIGPKLDWDGITRLRGARAIRLREVVTQGVDLGLLSLVPVWMMNPDVAAQLLPLTARLFDVVVFDEASQLPVERVLHVLYRAGRAVVSGDRKQMPPTQFFHSRAEDEEADRDGTLPDDMDEDADLATLEMEENSRDIRDCTDLLHLAERPLPEHVLEVHYRSRYRDLIGFSNAAFYQGRLHVPAQHPDWLVRTAQPIEYVAVNGTYRDQANQAEAEAVVDRLAAIWAGSDTPPSLGVITFNLKQADLINDLIEARAEDDPAFRDAFARESNRNEREPVGEDMAFFVLNVENCQGLERDWILFSSTFGISPQGGFRRNFGVLGQRGGERRLNVAVTRAREKIVFFSSMPVDRVSDFLGSGGAPASARDFLQGYLRYAEQTSAGSFDRNRPLLDRMLPTGMTRNVFGGGRPDGFRAVVEAHLRGLDIDPVAARDGSAFAIDFALPHPDSGRFVLGIECDTPDNRLLRRPRDREIWRRKVLAMGIPQLHRVSSTGWYADPLREQALLGAAIDAAFTKEVGP